MLWTPFIVASAALLTHVLDLDVDRLILVAGDHIDGAKLQVEREPLPPPKVRIVKPRDVTTVEEMIEFIEGLTIADVELTDSR
jgi:thymidylate synthase